MSLAYYMDVHVPASITLGLRRRGIVVLTSQEDGTRRFTDSNLLERATALAHVLVSQDADLLALARQWQAAAQHFCGIVFAPQTGSSIGVLIEDLYLIAECMTLEEISEQVVYVPLK